MNLCELLISQWRHCSQDEKGEWRRLVYSSAIARLLAVLQPWPDILCPDGVRYKAFDWLRAFGMLLIVHYFVRLALEIPGHYASFDPAYHFEARS